MDSFFFQFYLSLYGHKLPVLCLDISYDSTIIATGSADRNVKLWGMDFGDCHKSIFAHNDSVTSLQFVPSTHYFFTVSKDGKVKQWDADSYDNIITLNVSTGHMIYLHLLTWVGFDLIGYVPNTLYSSCISETCNSKN
jgi:WD40 repeat protein